MSRYSHSPLSFTGLKTISLHDRDGKVRVEHFAATPPAMPGFLDALPKLLAADSLRAVVAAIAAARERKRAIIWGMGGHVIKCGLAPVFTSLMDRGYATSFACNGSTTIHDFEIALSGSTSEDVEAVLPDGRFGSAAETGQQMNLAIRSGAEAGLGMGESIGKHLHQIAPEHWREHSLQWQAYQRSVPFTVHVAVGTDTPHTFPEASGAAIGEGTLRDFRLLCSLVRELHDGGVYVNVGSAVVLPEVFLKAVSVVRNLGYPLREFTTVNFDFLQHYRPNANVVKRPHANAGGQGYAITGHHEILIPLLAALLPA
ncbi:MAG: hypothetical protein K2X03_27540 [Bryobacteraceae bacterium]|nr:hypothetical protein [Bryobacteraceae bacterium]